MIGLYLKFSKARLIRTMFNKALFRVEEVQLRWIQLTDNFWLLMIFLLLVLKISYFR